MRNNLKILLIVIFTMILTGLFLRGVKADKVFDSNPASISFQRVLQEIGDKYGVTIIADPSLDGTAVGSVQGETVEETLKCLLAPSGYNFTKIDDYYIINGPKSPLTVMAETESSLVPVGFLDAKNWEVFEEYSQYLTYDKVQGLVYVKAPTSLMNKILSKLWEVSKTSGHLSVAYNLQIIDIGNSSDLDVLFPAKFDSKSSQNQQLIVTPDQWLLESSIQAILQQKAGSVTNSMDRQPWLMVLPGKSVKLATKLHYIGVNSALDRNFAIKITPVRVDEGNGQVVSEVFIGQDCEEQNNSSNQNSYTIGEVIKTDQQLINKVSTTIQTLPGKRELLGVVRQNREVKIRRKILFWEFGFSKKAEQRDFMIFMTATPVTLQNTLAAAQGLIPIGSLNGMELLTDQEQAPPKTFIEMGLSSGFNDKITNPWLHLSAPISPDGLFQAEYFNPDRYSLGLSFALDSTKTTSMEFTAGKGIGPDHQTAIMVGLEDITQPAKYISLFGQYYPLSYLPDSNQWSNETVWLAGTRFGTDKLGLSLGAYGDPDYDGWFAKLEAKVRKCTWLLKLDMNEKNPTGYLGLKFSF